MEMCFSYKLSIHFKECSFYLGFQGIDGRGCSLSTDSVTGLMFFSESPFPPSQNGDEDAYFEDL